MFRRVTRTVLASAVAAILIVPATSVSAQEGGPIAPELTGLGTLHMPVTTSVPQAQRFFDQGLRLLYAFNHAEAIRAFREAARLDPGLAMAYWGWAIALGPNLNAPMSQENGRQAYSAIRQARALSSRATPREQALIEALSLRYSADGKGDRAALDRAYAGAMQKAADRFDDDPDVQTLFADALMNTMPWDYWQKDGGAKPETARILDSLEPLIKEVAAELVRQSSLAPWAEQAAFLVQLPGIGVHNAMVLLAAIGDIRRFDAAHKLVGYAGLGARVHSSGEEHYGGRITKQGRRDIRATMVEAAWVAVGGHPYWKELFERLAVRVGKPKAIIATYISISVPTNAKKTASIAVGVILLVKRMIGSSVAPNAVNTLMCTPSAIASTTPRKRPRNSRSRVAPASSTSHRSPDSGWAAIALPAPSHICP